MSGTKHLTLEDIATLLEQSELPYLSKLTGVPYTTLYNYKHGRSRLDTIPYHLVDKLSIIALLGTDPPSLAVTRLTHPAKKMQALLKEVSRELEG